MLAGAAVLLAMASGEPSEAGVVGPLCEDFARELEGARRLPEMPRPRRPSRPVVVMTYYGPDGVGTVIIHGQRPRGNRPRGPTGATRGRGRAAHYPVSPGVGTRGSGLNPRFGERPRLVGLPP